MKSTLMILPVILHKLCNKYMKTETIDDNIRETL